MSFNYYFLPVLLFGIAGMSFNGNMPQKGYANPDEPVTVSYCDLANAPDDYKGKLIRVRATVLTWVDGTSLYDAKCPDKGLDWAIDCDEKEERSAAGKLLQDKMDYNGKLEGRVEAVFVGRVVMDSNSAKSSSRPRLMIERVEEITRIPREVSWPK
jgi:hypothetical protein